MGKQFNSLMIGFAMLVATAAQATPIFQGRDTKGAVDNTCTATGSIACALFYDTTLDITILNNWNIGKGIWDANARPGSVQAIAEAAGFAATGLTGCALPTHDVYQPAGALDQFTSIWDDAGASRDHLQSQFYNVLTDYYWSGTEYTPGLIASGFFPANPPDVSSLESNSFNAVAVRAGDVAASVPELGSMALAMLALGTWAVASRRLEFLR